MCLAVPRPTPQHLPGSFWRKETPLLDPASNKIVVGGMWPHQQRWWDLPNFIKILVGGYGAGKTFLACKRAISLALQNAPCPVAIVSPTFPIARQTVVTTLQALLQGKQTIYGHQLWWRYNRSTHEFKIRYKGRQALIIVYSGEDPLALRGPNLAAALIDEPFIQDVEVFNQMVARVRHPDATSLEIGCFGTPESLNWGYDLCLGELKDKHDVAYIQASTRQNLALPVDYVGRLEGAFANKAADAYIEGSFVNLGSGLVYYAFDSLDKANGNVRDIVIPDDAELGCGMDFNVNPMCATIFWRQGPRIHFFDEIELPNADTEYLCSVLHEKYVGERKRTKQVLHYIYPDATGSARKTSAPGGKSDFWYIKDAGFEIRAPHENPKRKDRYNAVNGKLKPRAGEATCTVSPKCKKLIKYLLTYSHELMNKQAAMSHLLDAFGYPVSYLYPVTKEMLTIGKLVGH